MNAPIAQWDLACFSYLAHAQILHVPRYPAADHGTLVERSRTGLAADGPITACTAAALGLRTTLVANQVGDDPAGVSVTNQLRAAGVEVQASRHRPAVTPHLTVITDTFGTRSWFAELAQVHDSLHYADMSPLGRARLAYIDAYTVIASSAARAIDTAASRDVPVLLNLGNDPIHPSIAKAVGRARIVAVQTGLPENQADDADAVARDILDRLRPEAAIVTLGALGAIALGGDGDRHQVHARAVRVADTHGAGAAFSAGLAAAHLDGQDLKSMLARACAAGTAHCTSPQTTSQHSVTPRPRNEVPLCSPTT
ncbi:carbohydrate kinase family protein [Streptomyces sp. NPDC058961]|uniref:carbohydrate kinase family protein n=1 Tax=Streptomyces sp. NPDC058961 TaxID=3346680 RepID=UPI0036C0BBF5